MIKLNVPIAAFDLGAPAERIRGYPKGLILSSFDPEIMLDELVEFKKRMVAMAA